MRHTAGLIAILSLCLSGTAAVGGGDSATGPLDTVVPTFTTVVASPSQAASGQSVTLTFSASEPLLAAPDVMVNGNTATFQSANNTYYTYEYTVLDSDAPGTATVDISAFDRIGLLGYLSNTSALKIIVEGVNLPLHALPLALVFLSAGLVLLARQRRASTLLVLFLLFAPAALAANPIVTNVVFVQQPGGVHGTQVIITYDLTAPNGPCGITVSLSKNAGSDGFIYPITSLTGDTVGVTTGVGKRIVWDIMADYPNENVPNARLHVSANDSTIHYTLTYLAGAGGKISGTTSQTVLSGDNATPVTAVPNAGFAFTGWSDGVHATTRTDTNVSADKSVTANFIKTFTLTYTAGAGGTIIGVSPQTVNSGGNGSTVTAVANSGFVFVNWSDGLTTPSRSDANVQANRTVTANFIQTFTLTYVPGAGGRISGSTHQTVIAGGSGTPITAAPDTGFAFVNWSDGVLTATRTDANVLANISVTAIFTASLVEMISIASGNFSMGRTSSGDDAEWGGLDELPIHIVTLSAYTIGKYEVTNQQYCEILNYALSRAYLRTNAGVVVWSGIGDIYAGGDLQKILAFTDINCNIMFSAGSFYPKTRVGLPGTTNYSMGTHPVEDVSWYGAAAFCDWLSEIEGLTSVYDQSTAGWSANFANNGYHLPTEAQWERAAAWDGTKHWIYRFTSDRLTGKNCANYFDGTPGFSNGTVDPLGLTTQPYTSPVGWFNGVNVSPYGGIATLDSVSPVGCYDMTGNVTEWCHDWYLDYYYSTSPGIDPPGSATGTDRVARGGSWVGDPYWRSAQRLSYRPDEAYQFLGFRLAK